MKVKWIIFGIGLVINGLSAQNEQTPRNQAGQRHGTWEKYHENGTIRYRGRFSKGVPVDTFRYYYPTGDLRTLNIFRGQSGNCVSYVYGEEKKLAAKGLYRNQKKDSVWTYYDRKGRVISREPYEDGQKDGKVISYFPEGGKAEVIQYEDGEKDGLWKRFHENGKTMSKAQYQNGTLQGEATFYHENGKPRLKGSYKNGKMHGIWCHFDTDSQIEKKQHWEHGFEVNPQDSSNSESQKPDTSKVAPRPSPL